MKDRLSQQEIGKRIALLRKSKGWSQENLAKSIGLSRSSVVHLELGKRSLDVMELLCLSHAFSFTIDEFLANDIMVSLGLNGSEPRNENGSFKY